MPKRVGRDLAFLFADQRGHGLGLDRIDALVPRALLGNLIGRFQLVLGMARQQRQFRLIFVGVHIARFFGRLLREPDDRIDHGLHFAVAKHDSAEHHLFGELLRLGLDHQHGVRGAGDHQFELGIDHVVDQRVQFVFAADIADAGRPDRAHEGNAGERECGGRRHQRHHIGLVFDIVAEHGHDDLRLVAIARHEERPNGAVDEARDQRLTLGRASLALEIAARDFSGGIEFFLVIDGQGEEIDPELGLRLTNRGGKHHRFAVSRHDGPIGLARNPSGFKNELAPAPFDLLAMNIEHWSFPSFPSPDCRGSSLAVWSRKFVLVWSRKFVPAGTFLHVSAGSRPADTGS